MNSPHLSSQERRDYLCGNFSYGNGFEILRIHIKCDSTFEWSEFHDMGGWRPLTKGRWNSSGDTVFLTTPVQPKIIQVEETVESTDKITITFFDKYSRNITEDVPGIWNLHINGKQQNPDFSIEDSTLIRRYMEPYDSHNITFARTGQNNPLNTIDFSFDRILLSYIVKNPHASSFNFVLDLLRSDLAKEQGFVGQRRFFMNEPLLYHDNGYHLSHDNNCFYSPIADTAGFNMNYPLRRY
ncbi:MAG: hypothetical protein HZB59_05850 [Ignavibacteriales bacterium]|nr:hypothetical protein [Ignavibacteriales bacterium]